MGKLLGSVKLCGAHGATSNHVFLLTDSDHNRGCSCFVQDRLGLHHQNTIPVPSPLLSSNLSIREWYA